MTISNKKVLAIIPARAGSKGLPGKNIKVLAGHPLLAWTIKQAKNSKYIDQIYVSTDGREIADVAGRYGTPVANLRPSHLASDTAQTADVVFDILSELKKNFFFDYVLLLEPTSPLRKEHDIDELIEKMNMVSGNFDAVVTVGEPPISAELLKKKDGQLLTPLFKNDSASKRRQDLEKHYFPYGVGYIIKADIFERHRSFYPKKLSYYDIERWQCVEIDDEIDFMLVETIIRSRGLKI